MALNTVKCNYLTPLHFKGLIDVSICYSRQQIHSQQIPASSINFTDLCELL